MSKYIVDTGNYLFTTDGVLVVGFDCDNKPDTCYEPLSDLEELNSDYINEHFGELQDEAYQAGLNDAWEAAKKIMNMSDPPYWDVFGEYKNELFKKFSVSEAIAKLKAYDDEHSDRIEVGDEVICTTDNITLIVTSIYKVGSINWCDGVAQDGKVYSTLIENDRKTGKHYNIASILEAMRE